MFITSLINTKRLLLCGLFVLFFALSLTVSFGSSSVNAASQFDNIVDPVNELIVSPDITDTEHTYDLTYNLGGLILDENPEYSDFWAASSSSANRETYQNSFRAALDNGDWAFVQAYNGDARTINVFWSEDNEHIAEFQAGQDRLAVRGNSANRIYRLTIMVVLGARNDEPAVVGLSNGNVLNTIASTQSSTYGYFRPLLSTFSTQYPQDYEGEVIPDTFIPPIEYEQTPDWYVSEAIDWKVQIHDSNFNTFDEIEWTCNEGLAPVLYYEIWSVDDNTKLIDGYHNATAQIDWEAPKVDELRMYEVKGKYFCGDLPDDPQFPHYSTRQFAISEHGMLDFTPFYQCMTDEAPYVDFEACIASFERFINQLSFGAIGYTNEWSYQAECHHLGILGDWINAPNASRQVCPQFPAQVRNIITPFVTFLLGLMTITFIASRGEHGSRKDDI